ncbi:ABC transporter substrate-binding protein [Haloarcula onubensis]|uniref:ABC transporter substrate-binding protein n=1 Tax=Haloarcula onubensis TaxID=2950539 RepID=A0ABU2FPQ6_9EURY|nr:ABC transporter substrate-binding protein [Halomicroarcula sp. S3CR25-11]MDS0282743.1 ABC transporter substrate-binding protein [Halomicroarcula sp. S3CR25-11]
MTDKVSGKRRRTFMKTVAGSSLALLAGCGGGGGSSDDGSLTYVYPGYFSEDASDLVPMFEKQSDSISVESQQTPSDASSTREYYVNQFISGASSFDVGNMDVIWPAEFAGNGWAAEVSDPEGHTDNMLPTPVDSVTVDGTMYGMPIHTDANALYYRTDLLEDAGYDSPPETYMELVNMAQDIKQQSDQDLNGYIWQGGSNEGLTIMWLNWLWGMGGSIRQDGNLVVNSEEGIAALQHAVDLIHEYNVTPESIPASSTDQNRQTFQQGNTIFMRNWPYAVALMNEDGSAVKDKFEVAPMPKAEGHPDANNSCLGGWNLFINANANKPEAAQQFANYMASMEAQKNMALEHSRLPVRKELYSDEYYEQAPHLETFANIVDQTSARPATPNYSTFSEIVYTNCNAALVQDKSPEQALNDAQEEIDSEVNNA